MATVSTKMVLDTSGFNRGIKSAESSMSKFKSMAGTAAMAGIAAGFAAATAAAAGLAVGINKAVQIGGQLSDLAARTGVAAGELRVLQQAFDRNGLSADKVGTTINKMQRALVEAGQRGGETARAFDTLGLNLDSLRGMSSADQLQTIGQAIAALPDPAARAAAAMQIFGRSGGELLTLFSNAGALNDAARSIGGQADLLTKNADLFDRAADILNTIGTKLEGFFIGVADQVVPVLLPLLEAADSLDFADIGQSLGKGIAFALTAITSGQIGNLLTAQLKLSGAQFINTLVRGLTGIIAFLATNLAQMPANFVKILGIVTQPEFWSGVGNGLLAAAMKFAAIIQRAAASVLETVSKFTGFGGGMAQTYRDSADQMDAGAAEFGAKASGQLEGPLNTYIAALQESFGRSFEAMATAIETTADTIDTSELEAARQGIVDSISEQMEATQAESRARFEASKTATPIMDEEMQKAVKDTSGVITDSLQKVGGGGNFARFDSNADPELAESKKQTGLLETSVDLFQDLIAAVTDSMFGNRGNLDSTKPFLSSINPDAEQLAPNISLTDAAPISLTPDITAAPPNLPPLIPSLGVDQPAPISLTPQISALTPTIPDIAPSISAITPSLAPIEPALSVKQPLIETLRPQLQVQTPKLDTLAPALKVNSPSLAPITPDLQVSPPKLPAIRPPAQQAAQFPNFAASGDTAAQHLRESQKQTGLLSRILEKLNPAQMTLMPA